MASTKIRITYLNVDPHQNAFVQQSRRTPEFFSPKHVFLTCSKVEQNAGFQMHTCSQGTSCHKNDNEKVVQPCHEINLPPNY